MASTLPTFGNRRGSLIVAVLIVAALVLGAAKASSSGTDQSFGAPVAVSTGGLLIELDPEVSAGSPITARISNADPDRTIDVVFGTSYGQRRELVSLTSSTETVDFVPFAGPASGLILVTAVQGLSVSTTQFELVPGPAVDPIDIFLGARTVVADGRGFVMHVAVPEDRFGNPVADATVVDYRIHRPDAVEQTLSVGTVNLLASARISATTVAGLARVVASSGTASASERTFLQVAGPPTEVVVDEPATLPPADGATLFELETQELRDRFGNLLPDGVVAHLDLDGKDGRHRQSSIVIDGRVRFPVEAPSQPGEITLTVTCDGVSSAPKGLTFTPAVNNIPIDVSTADNVSTEVAEVESAETIITIGPVISAFGGYVPDGTQALISSGQHSFTVTLVDGIGAISLDADIDLTTMTVEVLGWEEVVDG